jgi:large subunit ribosomal protein L27
MAHKKGQGSSRNGRDSPGQHRGIKIFGGESVVPGNILVRQVGTKVHAVRGVSMGRDFTLYALVEGIVKYQKGRGDRVYVHVEAAKPQAEA